MSLFKHLEEKAEYILAELKIRAIHQQRDHGHIADDLKKIIEQLEGHVNVQAPTETIDPVVVNNVSSAPAVDNREPVADISVESVASVVTTEVQQVAPVAIPLTCVAPQ